MKSMPKAHGLYDPAREHDACGIGFVADSTGRASREIVDALLEGLHNVRHRGATAGAADVGAARKSGTASALAVSASAATLRKRAERVARCRGRCGDGAQVRALTAPGEAGGVSLIRVAQLAAEVGFPAGAINIVTGYGHEVGDALARQDLALARRAQRRSDPQPHRASARTFPSPRGWHRTS